VSPPEKNSLLLPSRSAVFFPTATLVLFFALPCFFVRDPEKKSSPPVQLTKVFATLKEMFSRINHYKSLFQFIIIHFLILDAVNTIIVFMAVYATKAIGFSGAQFLISSTVGAIVCSGYHSNFEVPCSSHLTSLHRHRRGFPVSQLQPQYFTSQTIRLTSPL
jgi:MFS-type transporter involved in bile tolerance (Atg22 family)